MQVIVFGFLMRVMQFVVAAIVAIHFDILEFAMGSSDAEAMLGEIFVVYFLIVAVEVAFKRIRRHASTSIEARELRDER